MRISDWSSDVCSSDLIPAGIAKRNPAASMAKALPKVPPAKKQAAIIDRIEKNDERLRAARQLLIDCEAQRTRAGTKFALRLLALTEVRAGEQRGARGGNQQSGGQGKGESGGGERRG